MGWKDNEAGCTKCLACRTGGVCTDYEDIAAFMDRVESFFQVTSKSQEKNQDKGKERIKSDGGVTSYYLTTLPKGTFTIDPETGACSFMLEAYMKYALDNDFDRCNLAKANHRIGRKEGNELTYETNKMRHYINRIEENYK